MAAERSLAVAPTSDAPGTVRRWVRHLGEVDPEACEIVELLLTELVTNSIRHAGLSGDERIEVHVNTSPRRVRAEVVDPGRSFKLSPAHPRPENEGGWGLFVLDQLADRWGYRSEGRNEVWFELDTSVEGSGDDAQGGVGP